jgi:hypothetical protein
MRERDAANLLGFLELDSLEQMTGTARTNHQPQRVCAEGRNLPTSTSKSREKRVWHPMLKIKKGRFFQTSLKSGGSVFLEVKNLG